MLFDWHYIFVQQALVGEASSEEQLFSSETSLMRDGIGCDIDFYLEKIKLQCDKMVMVAFGWRHTISVSSSGGLHTYGWSKYGQLGHGDFEDYLVPHKLQALSDKLICQKIVQISCGWRHIIAIIERENVYSWGRGTL